MHHLHRLEDLNVNFIGVWISYKKGALSIGNYIVINFLIVQYYILIIVCLMFINDNILIDLFKQKQ